MGRRFVILLAVMVIMSGLGQTTSSRAGISGDMAVTDTEGVVVIDGPLTVTGPMRFLNATIYLSGNLTVTSSGTLEFVNTTLFLNLSRTGQYRADIAGTFIMDDFDRDPSTEGDASGISSNNSLFRYGMTASSTAKIDFCNSVISDCGFDGLNPGFIVSTAIASFEGMAIRNGHYGISLRNSGARMVNSTVSACYYGVHAYFCNPALINVTVAGCTARGIYLYNSKPAVSGCRLVNNKVGIMFQNSEPDVVSCTISGSETAGMVTWYSSPLLRDCALSNTLDMDVALNSFPRLLNTTLNESRVNIGLGLYVSVGQHLAVLATDESGDPMVGMTVAVLDSEGNPASRGTTGADGTASGLAYRERLLTADGPIEMSQHRIMAFRLDGWNISFGENATALNHGDVPEVTVTDGPAGIDIWPDGLGISEPLFYNSTKIITLGSAIIYPGGSLSLSGSEFLVYGTVTESLAMASGSLRLSGSVIQSIGASRLLEPSPMQISADAGSQVQIEDSEVKWVTELSISGTQTVIHNLSVEHASACGLKLVSNSATVEQLAVDWALIGLSTENDASWISGVKITHAREHAIYSTQSSAQISNARVTDSARGMYAYACMMELSDFNISGCEYGLFAYYSMIELANASFSGSVTAGLYLIGSAAEARNVSIVGSGKGVHADGSEVWIDSSHIYDNTLGLWSGRSAPVLLNCTLQNAVNIRVERASSAALVNCTIDMRNNEILPSGFIDIGNWTDVLVFDETIQPVPGCNVSVRDPTDRVSSSGITDANGTVSNLAYREKRQYWNRTEEYGFQTVAAVWNANGTQYGSNVSTLYPNGLAEVMVTAGSGGIVEWPSYKTISSDIRYSGKDVIAHGGIGILDGGSLHLENSTLWFFATPGSYAALSVYGSFSLNGSRVMPLSADRPLQPFRAWITYQVGSGGSIIDSEIRNMYQITTYTGNLTVSETTIAELAETGLFIQRCSPKIQNSVFIGCLDGIWSYEGAPAVSNVSFIECGTNGICAEGGAPEINSCTALQNVNGFSLLGEGAAKLEKCLAADNGDGFYMEESSPYLGNCTAMNNTVSGVSMQDSHPVLETVTSSGNSNGLYCYRSWPQVLNSTMNENLNGIYAQDSAPYVSDCTVNGNSVGLNIAGDATGILEKAFTSGLEQEHSTFIGGGVRDHISVSLPARAIVRYANLSITGAEIGDDAVITDNYIQYAPAIYGDWIVWQDFRNEDWDIYAYNLSLDSDSNGVPNYLETPELDDDPALVRITERPEMQGEADVFNDTIVWTDYRSGNPDIYAYTFSNDTEWAVCTDWAAQSKPSIDGDHIVWQDSRNGNYDIYMLNITGGEVSRLTDIPYNDMAAKIQGEHVVWYSYYGSPPSSDYSDIYMFDLVSWNLTNLNNDGPVQYNPDIYGDTVVWHDNRNVNWEIYACDLETMSIGRLTVDPEGEQNFMPRIYGDRVVYYFHNRLTGIWSVRMSNTTTGEMKNLEDDTDGDSIPVICEDKIAWLNKSANLNDIYVLDLALAGTPENASVDINSDGMPEFVAAGEFSGTETINGTWLADEFNKYLDTIKGGDAVIPISVAAEGTGRIILGPMAIRYDIPTYIVGTAIENSTLEGVRCSGSSPTLVNSSISNNPVDFSMNTGAGPRTLNSTFSDAKLLFHDTMSNLTVQNYLHVLVQNLSMSPLNATVTILDGAATVRSSLTGSDGRLEWTAVTDARYNITGRMENVTTVTVSMGSNIFPGNPRDVDMAVSHWEVFSTDSEGPFVSSPFPPPDWTCSQVRPEISVILTDNLGLDLSTVRLYVQGFMVFYTATPVPGGYNISYQHPMDFAEGSAVQCRIFGKDFHGNAVDFAWKFTIDTDSVSFTLELEPGWNLISLPFDTYNMSVESVLRPIEGKYVHLLAYSSADPDDPWLGFRPGRDPAMNDFTEFDRRNGYWIFITENCSLQISGVPSGSTAITLNAGWNLVGYPTLDEAVTLSFALWGTGADRAEGHDPGSPSYMNALASDYVMKPGEGYWVHVNFDTVWVVDW